MSFNRQSFWSSIPPVTKNLLIINVLVWLAEVTIPRATGFDMMRFLGLHFWQASDFNLAQLFTYMFMHDDASISHLFFNMFSLWMFGPMLERVMNSKRFLFYYLSCGIGAALVQEVVWTLTWKDIFIPALANLNGVSFEEIQTAIAMEQLKGNALPFLNELVTVGASGAIFGILLAFGMIFPNLPLYIMFIPIPIKAKWMVLGYGAIELLFGVTGAVSSVAHFAHLGGMLFGLIIILIWKKKGTIGGGFYQ